MAPLPAHVQVIERGWLSANSVLVSEGDTAVLVDAGYVGHAEQTVALVRHALAGRSLTRLINTHCHSDHMGGNAAIRRSFGCAIGVPEGEAPLIACWDERALLLTFADQRSERFEFDETFGDGDPIRMGGTDWQVVAVPGHDPHAVAFFDPRERILISGDALWQNGFGVLFGALWGRDTTFDETRQTLQRLAALDPRIVIPGHGPVFDHPAEALAYAFSRLEYYERDLGALARHCAKVMLTYSLLDKRSMPLAALPGYVAEVPILADLNARFFRRSPEALADWLVSELSRAGAIQRAGDAIVPAIRA